MPPSPGAQPWFPTHAPSTRSYSADGKQLGADFSTSNFSHCTLCRNPKRDATTTKYPHIADAAPQFSLAHWFSTDGPWTTSGPHAKSLLVHGVIRKRLEFNGLLVSIKICPYSGYFCICIDIVLYWWSMAKIPCVVKAKVGHGVKKVENHWSSQKAATSSLCTWNACTRNGPIPRGNAHQHKVRQPCTKQATEQSSSTSTNACSPTAFRADAIRDKDVITGTSSIFAHFGHAFARDETTPDIGALGWRWMTGAR